MYEILPMKNLYPFICPHTSKSFSSEADAEPAKNRHGNVHAVGIPAVATHYELFSDPFAKLLYAVLPYWGLHQWENFFLSELQIGRGLVEAEHSHC